MSALRMLPTLWLAWLLALPAQAQGLVPVPPLAARVTDQAGMLDPSQRERLEAVLADYEAKSGSQIAVLLVKSTEPEAIEQYSIRVADAWKLGRKGIDDGVLLLVARDNPKSLRRLRIEAGRGVQGVLTDAQSKRILQDVIAPHFRQNDYYGGLVAGTGAIAALLDQEHFAAPKRQQAQGGEPALNDLLFPLAVIVMGVGFLMRLARSRMRRSLSSQGWGSGAAGFVLGNVLNEIAHNAGRHHRGGFGGGGFGGGGFGGGGGGSFDGGGASGDW